MEVDIIRNISNLNFNDYMAEKNFNMNIFFIALLAAFNDKKDICFKQDRNGIISRIIRHDYAVILSVSIFVFSLLSILIASRVSDLNAMKNFVSDDNNIMLNNEIITLKKEITHLENLLNNMELLKTASANEDCVRSEIFREIKYAVPPSTIVTSISVDRSETQLYCDSDSVEEVTIFLNNLRNIRFIESIYVPSIEVKQDLNGKYSYTAVCVLKEVQEVVN